MRGSDPPPGAAPGQAGRLLLGLAVVIACAEPPPRLEAPLTVRVRDHQEVELTIGAAPVPKFLGEEVSLSLCLETAATTDTSQWEARLELDGMPLSEDFAAPSVGLGNVLCFDAPVPRGTGRGKAKLGGAVRDRFDGARRRLPEQPVYLEPEAAAYSELRRAMIDGVKDPRRSPREIAEGLLRLAAEAESGGYPQLATRGVLMAVHFLRSEGSDGSIAQARRRLAELPSWLEDEAASFWGSQVALAQADLARMADGDLGTAWRRLRLAADRQLRIADPTHIETIRLQSIILARVDAAGEGVERLRTAIEGCERWPCNPTLLLGARITLGWLTLLDPQAEGEDFERAHRASEAALEQIPEEQYPEERANLLANLAHLEHLLGRNPEPFLARASGLLDSVPQTITRREIEGWIELVRGSHALATGNAHRALEICVRLAEGVEAPQVAAWAWGCAGRALRSTGDLALAAQAFDQALRFHSHTTSEQLGQLIALGISRRSEDYFSAARLAVDRGDVDGAWDLLSLLDRLGDRTACVGGTTAEQPSQRRERRSLLRALAALEQPAAEVRRRQQAPLRQSIRQRLQELWRQQPGCSGAAGDTAAEEPRFRAFLVEGELLLLEHDPALGPRVARRSSLSASDLRRRMRQAAASPGGVPLADAEWRRLLEPVAAALVPPVPSSLGPVTTFALHGLLQDVPLAALPLAGTAESPGPWLSSLTIPIHRPARPGAEATPPAAGSPLFLVDPLGDLMPASERESYRRFSPGSRILSGSAATGQAFRRALSDARWLHIDAHGSFDPAYPELSSLAMADGPVTFIELSELPVSLRFANLSSCLTGRWPITADSGHYGIAGLLVQRGVPWVIASRGELDNRFAKAFNLAFYRSLDRREDAASAFRDALEAVRGNFPAAVWGSLLLLGRRSSRGERLAAIHSPPDGGRTAAPLQRTLAGETP